MASKETLEAAAAARLQDKIPVRWKIRLTIPFDRRLVRRSSNRALRKALAKALVVSVQNIPPEFIVQSADKLKEALKDGQAPALHLPGAKPFRM